MSDNIKTPEGRLINNSVWEKEAYKNEKGKEGVPQYKVEMAFDIDVIEELEAAVVAAAVEEWGEGAENDYWGDPDNKIDPTIRSPFKDGDKMAQERAEKGKSGDAYAGLVVMRANTIFNEHGEDAPGGLYVAGADAVKLDFTERGTIYNGSYGVAVVAPGAYEVNDNRGVTLYLLGYQFTRDGDPLRGVNVGAMFEPMTAESETKGRKRRRG